MELLAALAVFGAIVCLVIGLMNKPSDVLETRMANLRGENRTVVDALAQPQNETFSARLLAPMAASFGAKLEKLLPTTWISAIETGLLRAGQPTSTQGFLIAAVLCFAVCTAMGFMLVSSLGMGGMTGIALMGALAGMGAYLPKMWLGARVRSRQKEISKSLPDAFDLIVTCVEAGLGLEAALARVAEKTTGPFGEELTLCLREVSMGKLRREALKEMADRTGVPDLTGFINAVVQAETMGTSIGTVLRVQAEQMRIKRRQRAEQQAHAAPVKMMFPLVLCLFPTLFIVILGPAGISIYQNFVTGVAK
jgi:tight adherence protein C